MIHNSCVIEKEAKIGNNVKVGPFCYIGPKVKIDDDVELIFSDDELINSLFFISFNN